MNTTNVAAAAKKNVNVTAIRNLFARCTTPAACHESSAMVYDAMHTTGCRGLHYVSEALTVQAVVLTCVADGNKPEAARLTAEVTRLLAAAGVN